ncbi:MAG: RND family efflux transporter MFP subunit [Crocinitomicaceae bacterium]|jgi:RND family efflux transporter MFP subunit
MKILKKITIKHWIALGALVLITIFIFFGLKKNQNDAYSSFTVEEATVSDELLLAGTIDAKERVDLGFASSGRVKKVNFKVGEVVKKGQIIAEIEQNRLVGDLTQAQANYTLTRVDTQTDVSSANDSLSLKIAEQDTIVAGLFREYLSGDLQAYNVNSSDRDIVAPLISGSYNSTDVGTYNIDVYSSSSNSGYSFRLSGLESGTFTSEVNRAGALGSSALYIQFKEGESYGNTDWIVPVPNTRSATFATRKRAYESALASRDRIITDAENNIDRVSGLDTKTSITRDEARRAQARAQVNAVAAQLGDGKIRAPFDGIIAKNDLEIGEVVNAFTTKIVIFGGEEKELNLNTPEIYINKIVVGDSVAVTLDAYDDLNLTGTVNFIDFIDTEVNGVPVYKTDITINILDERIRTGMNAKASIISKQRIDVLAIPAHYITKNDDGEQTVMIKKGEHLSDTEIRIIETGLRGNEGLVEVMKGLSKGDIILLENK